MNKQDYIDGAESALLHTYNRFPLVIDHGVQCGGRLAIR